MPYFVRPMYQEDLAQVAEIDREAFPTQWPPDNYRRELENLLAHYITACDNIRAPEEPEAKVCLEQPPHGLVFRLNWWFKHNSFFNNGASPAGKQFIVGFAGIWVMADEAHITNIAVRKRYQRQGIGELLLIAIIDLATELKASMVTLEVRASNTTAQNLYTKYGFIGVGLRRGYYTDNREDAIIMSTESIISASFQEHLQQRKQALSRRLGMATIPVLARNNPARPDQQ
ncbi:ribosomal protein S18-alanine N-acetyltransferase [Chloroflexota bacterium]